MSRWQTRPEALASDRSAVSMLAESPRQYPRRLPSANLAHSLRWSCPQDRCPEHRPHCKSERNTTNARSFAFGRFAEGRHGSCRVEDGAFNLALREVEPT